MDVILAREHGGLQLLRVSSVSDAEGVLASSAAILFLLHMSGATYAGITHPIEKTTKDINF